MKYNKGTNPNSRNGFKKGHKLTLGIKRNPLSEEHKNKISESNKGKHKGQGFKLGHSVSNITKEKLSNTWKEKYQSGYINPKKGKDYPIELYPNYGIRGKKRTKEWKNQLEKKVWGKRRNKTLEEVYGENKAKEIKKDSSESHKGYIMPKEQKIKIKEIWNTPEMKESARQRRLKQKIPTKHTSIELKIKSFLDELHIPYKTHKAIMGITQPDFFIEPNICIYCDGDYWHNLPITIERDKKINETLKFGGYKVIRIWEHDIRVMELNNLRNKIQCP